MFSLVPTRMALLYSGLGKALEGALPELQAPPLLGAKGGCQTALLRRVWEGRDVALGWGSWESSSRRLGAEML